MVDKYQKILVPLDGSKLAEKALPYAQDIAIKSGSEISLLNVRLPAEDPYHPILKPYLDKVANNLNRDIKNQMPKRKKHVEIYPLTVSGSEFVRHPAEGIVDYSLKEKIDLIIMASHGHSGIKHWALGGVSDRLLHMSNIPVLLIRAGGNSSNTFDRILAPLDGSELAECILKHVTKIAAVYNSSKIVFLRVVEPFFHVVQGEGDGGDHVYTEKEIHDIELKNKSSAKNYLEKVMDKVGPERSITKAEVLAGNVAETIIDYSRNNDIGLVIMSTHGHSGMNRWTLGSITERVLRYSELPVLLVRAQECSLNLEVNNG